VPCPQELHRVGAVFCLEASRLARNRRDWHHLLELCGLVGTHVIAPDRRIQDAVRVIFRLFERLGSARQVLLHMRREDLTAPRPLDGRHTAPGAWRAPVYRTGLAILQNPFYAGAYAYGESQTRTTIIDGTVRKAHGRRRPMNTWTALVRDHHETYISVSTLNTISSAWHATPSGNARASRRRAGAATRCSRVSCDVGAVGGCFL